MPKVMFIGMDAADKDVMNQWAEDGLLPTWKRLQQIGLTVETDRPLGVYVGAIWPSFYTGVNPARHEGLASQSCSRKAGACPISSPHGPN